MMKLKDCIDAIHQIKRAIIIVCHDIDNYTYFYQTSNDYDNYLYQLDLLNARLVVLQLALKGLIEELK